MCVRCCKQVKTKDIFRIYFDNLLGPATKEFREIQDNIKKLERENDGMREEMPRLSEHVDMLAQLVQEDMVALKKVLEDVEAAIKDYHSGQSGH
ncbi:hypothetical protein FRC11_012752 [Ceratobasidium sp. 423]|nr:hypothetical protein FRC11_012752 [Ceratobasidium sp. 423]